MTFFPGSYVLYALFHLQAPDFAHGLVFRLVNNGPRITLLHTGGVSIAIIAFVSNTFFILFDHSIGTRRDTVTAPVTFIFIHHYDFIFIFINGFMGAGFQAVGFGTLKTDAGHRIAVETKIVDMNS
jgi:hypothetical protein